MVFSVPPQQFTYIGQWLSRFGRGAKRHLIESEIADRFVTRCGREMRISLNGNANPFVDHEYCQPCGGGPDAR